MKKLHLKRKLTVAGLTLISCIALSASAQQSINLPNTGLASPRFTERKQASREINANRNETIKQLVRIAQTDVAKPQRGFYEPKQLAIDLLGDYRAEEAVVFLVSEVRLQVSVVRTEVIPFDDFPSARALVKIGNPSIMAILKRLSPLEGVVDPNPLDERDLHLFAYIIREIDGHEVGLYRLEQAAKEAKGAYKIHLLDLIDLYKLKETEFDIKRKIVRPAS